MNKVDFRLSEDQYQGAEPAPTRLPPPDDDELAVILHEDWRNKVAYFHNSWWVYEDGVWVSRDQHEVNRHIRQFLRTQRGRGVSVNQRRISALAAMMVDDVYMSNRRLSDQQADASRYINLRNGLYNLETHSLEQHRPDLMMTTQLDFAFDDNASCPTFDRFLRSSLVLPDTDEADLDLTAMTKQALAYSMTARTDLKASFWLLGKPDSGKSTLIAFLRSLMGNLHATIDLNQLATNRFLLSGIVGKRVVTFTESSSNTILPDALYKSIVGGDDEIYVDVKNRPGISFKPEFKLWWAMNEAPRISDRSGATFNRLRLIPFNRSIPKDERDPQLLRKLESEKAGVFNELMVFYRQLQRDGKFRRVQQCEALLKEYELENDTEATYLDECTERHEAYRVQSSLLYRDYANWCEDRGFRTKNYNQIAREWRRLGLISQKTGGVIFWHGARIKPTKNI
jgi:putative DNA primase/helicase